MGYQGDQSDQGEVDRCNSGGCHGKASGQNGFRLSLLGFEPALDYETLVNEGRGRRLFPDGTAISKLTLLEPPKSFRSGITLLRYAA